MKKAAAIELLSRLKQDAEDHLEALPHKGDPAVIYSAWRVAAVNALNRGFGEDSPTADTLFEANQAAAIARCGDVSEARAMTRSLLEADIECLKSKRKTIVNSVGDEVE